MSLTKVTYSMIDGAPFNVLDYGADPTGVASSTAAIQAAIDAAFAAGGGVVSIPAGTFKVTVSTLTETLWNAGVAWPATDGCLVLRDNVHLIGEGIGATKLLSDNANKTVIQISDGNNTRVSGLTVDGNWSGSGAGHGIIQLLSTDDDSTVCENMAFDGLFITNVGSYGIGIENGDCYNVYINNVRAYNIGADGIDFKNRGTVKQNTGIFISNVYIEKFGQRVSLGNGMVGIDVRGVASISNVQVKMVSAVGIGHGGIRFRTAAAVAPNQEWGAKSSLNNFYIYSDDVSSSNVQNGGVSVGSADVNISNGYIENCYLGFSTTGNVSGSATNVAVSQVTVNNSSFRAFWTAIGCDNTRFTSCMAVNSGVGFKVDSNYTTLISCQSVNTTTGLNNSTAASEFTQAIGCVLNDDYGTTIGQDSTGAVAIRTVGDSANITLRLYSKGLGGVELRDSDTRSFRAGATGLTNVNCVSVQSSDAGQPVQILPLGSDADVDLWLREKGAGNVRFGEFTASADAPVVGYITIKDGGGNIRKLAVIA
jgi:hypothetical protein